MRALLPVVTLLAAALPLRAAAQVRATFSSARFQPALGPDNYLGVVGATSLPPPRRAFGLYLDYATDPLVAARPCAALSGVRACAARDLPFVAKTGLVHLSYARGLGRRAQLAIDVPLGGSDATPLHYTVFDTSGSSPHRTIKPRDGFVLGDLRVETKVRLWASPSRRLRIGAAASATVPTSLLTSDRGTCAPKGGCTFLGERGTQVTALGIVEIAPRRALRAALNAGVRYRPEHDLLGAQVGSEAVLAAALQYAPLRDLRVTAELDAGLTLTSVAASPAEARGALTYGGDLQVTLGAGAGLTDGVGSPRYRLLAGLTYIPIAHDSDGDRVRDGADRCPDQPEDRDGYEDDDGCPDLDDDGDGVPDHDDACPREPEDVDGFEDDDGCPDPDNDGDGVLDGYDSCEGAQEDYDGDHDDDGCPDTDTDRDGVEDAVDRCPDVPEDTDGLEDEDGCPDEDVDGDGLPDVDDACPETPETLNGTKDEDGCPD